MTPQEAILQQFPLPIGWAWKHRWGLWVAEWQFQDQITVIRVQDGRLEVLGSGELSPKVMRIFLDAHDLLDAISPSPGRQDLLQRLIDGETLQQAADFFGLSLEDTTALLNE